MVRSYAKMGWMGSEAGVPRTDGLHDGKQYGLSLM
jgi:hypothetical protein